MKISTFLLIFLLSFNYGFTQISIKIGNTEIDYTSSQISYKIINGVNVKPATFYRIKKYEWQSLGKNSIILKKNEQTIWLKIPLSRLSDQIPQWIVITDPHINKLKVFITKKDSIIQEFKETGDHHPFNSRTIALAEYAFPLKQINYNECEVIIAAEKRHTNRLIPIKFLTEEQMYDTNRMAVLINGILIGLTGIILLYNIFLFVIIKQKIYLWYSLYVMSVLLYFISELGIGFEYFYPNLPQINDVLRIGLLSFSLIPFMKFINLLLEVKQNAHNINKINKYILQAFIIVFVFGILSSSIGSYKSQEISLKVFHVISPLIILIIWIESVILIKKKIKYAGYANISLTIFLISYIIYALTEKRLIHENIITDKIIIIGISIDIFIMTAVVGLRFNQYKKETEILITENEKNKIKLISSLNDYKETEMLRISNMLHDTIGARLSALRLNIDAIIYKSKFKNTNLELEESAAEVSLLAEEVRNLSHNLSPVLLKNRGLTQSLKHIINLIDQSKINIHLDLLGNIENTFFSNKVMIYYIVFELIQNIIKHSYASEAIIQIIVQDDIISIYIEDNGIGFEILSTNEGLGLTQIKEIIYQANGHITIKSILNEGCKISIEFEPLKND